MESKPPSFIRTQWQRSTIHRFLRWFFRWKIQRRFLFCVLAFITVVVGYCGIENWRGQRAWKRYAAKLKAAGLPLSITEIVPAVVPDDQNFVATPYWAGLRYDNAQPYVAQRDTNRWPENASLALRKVRRLRTRSTDGNRPYHAFDLTDLPALELAFRQIGQKETGPDPNLPTPTDSGARQLSAKAILQSLAPYESVFEEMRQASGRPKARFPIRYDTDNPAAILLPHLAVIKDACQTLRMKVVAELAAGNSAQAREDVLLMLRLADAVVEEPILISYLVHLACVQLTLSTVWEGMVFHSWTSSDLEKLQAALQPYKFIELTERALNGERAFGNAVFDYLLRTGGRSDPFDQWADDPERSTSSTPFSLMPRGWFYLEKVSYNRLFDMYIDLDPHSNEPRARPELLDAKAAELEKTLQSSNPATALLQHQLFARLLLPAINKTWPKGVRAEAFAEMAVIACALERYRLSQGSYPATLAELTPKFINKIPNDVVSDQPYHYQRKTGDAFVLYSVGWNQTDDGGKEERPPGGDWVWRDLVP